MMEVVQSPLPVYAIVVSLAAAFLIGLSSARPNLREFWTLGAAVAKFSLILLLLNMVLKGQVIEYHLITVLPGLDIRFKVDALGICFAVVASFLWIITSLYSIGYMRAFKEQSQTRYYICFAVALSAAIGVAFAANMFTAFVFYEMITFVTFPLVAHKQTPEAISGARRYLIYLLGTSVFFQLAAIFLTYFAAGTLDFASGGILAGTGSAALLTVIFILYILGIGKAAMMPFHSWLPAAMVAPAPVSALLHAVAVVKAGVFVVLRVVLHIFGVDLLAELGLGTALMYFASFTILVASLIALRQDNLKARLAYSTISQLSYVILGASLLTAPGIVGSVMHIVVHAAGKITLFFAAGAIYLVAHKTEVSELNGLGREMPFTMGAFAVGAISMIGIPPLGGFLSKWYITLGALEAHELVIVLVIAASTILNACYFLPIVYSAFFREPKRVHEDSPHGHKDHAPKFWPWERSRCNDAPFLMVAAMALTAAGAILLFFAPSVFLDLSRMIVAG